MTDVGFEAMGAHPRSSGQVESTTAPHVFRSLLRFTPRPTLLLISAALASLVAAVTTAPQPANLQTPDAPDVTPTSWNRAHLRLRELADRSSLSLGSTPSYMSIAVLLLALLSIVILSTQHGKRNTVRLPPARLGLFIMVIFTTASYFLFVTLSPGWATGATTTKLSSSQGTGTRLSTSTAPIFTVPASADIGLNVLPNVKDPDAVDPQDVCPGYKASNFEKSDSGFTADLRLAGPACNVYGNDIEDLTLLVKFQTADRIHLQIQPRYMGPQNESWFLLPEVLVPSPPDTSFAIADHRLEVSWSNEPSFGFSVTRRDTGDILFTTEGKALVFEDQFFEFGSPLPENYNLYGLGETIHGFRLGNNLTRTLFNSDVGDVPDSNIYGTHPMYLDTRYFTKSKPGDKLTYVANPTDNKKIQYRSFTHGVYLRNAHAQEVMLRPSGITWRGIGGSIDLYLYAGPNAKDVIKSYQESAAGLPAMQQYWTLGYHQCRWGYDNWTMLQDVVDGFERFGIPLETIWVDIDYMKRYRDFDNDPVRFGYKEGAEFLAKLHHSNRHFVPIVDSAIYAPNPENPDDAYETFDRGVKADAFMLNPDGSLYIGAVWPGYTVFPDWIGAVLNGTGAIDWWINEFELWYKKIKFDGIWIDMSEVASFCVGSCGTGNLTLNPAHPPFALPGEPGNLVLSYPEGFSLTNASEAASASSALATQYPPTPTTSTTTTPYHRTTPTPGARDINWPPYVLNAFHGDLAVHGLSPNATHHGHLVDYDFHNLYGHQILNATYHALLKTHPTRRPFIIGRSTFVGSGRLAGHWGGDNDATWAAMAASIPQAFQLSLAGVPFFGADACGFNGNTDAELCARWMQLAAFFPFYRNHNALGARPQEPYVWSSVADATKTAMHIRYILLPYMYTLLALAHKEGGTFMRALAWEFPHEPWLAGVDKQFLVGPAVMVLPVLEPGAKTARGVFPGGEGTVWYDWYTQTAVPSSEAGEEVSVDAPVGHIPVYLRGGQVVATQEPGMTTAESRGNPWGVVVGLDRRGVARGMLYLDDGKSLEGEEMWVEFFAKDGTLYTKMTGNYTDRKPLANVTVMGVGEEPRSVRLNGTELDDGLWVYSRERRHLQLVGLEGRFDVGAWRWGWRLSWE
ncbi:family 31 glycosyl hydrolase [Podospora conica]|nr:family 31 glycosyl hydrolase [Schizothecium conicum]